MTKRYLSSCHTLKQKRSVDDFCKVLEGSVSQVKLSEDNTKILLDWKKEEHIGSGHNKFVVGKGTTLKYFTNKVFRLFGGWHVK